MARSRHDRVHTSWFVFSCKEQSRNNGRSFLQPAVCIVLLASTVTVAGAGRHRFRPFETAWLRSLLCIFLFFLQTRETRRAAAACVRAIKNPARHPARAAGVVSVNTLFWKILVTRVKQKVGAF